MAKAKSSEKFRQPDGTAQLGCREYSPKETHTNTQHSQPKLSRCVNATGSSGLSPFGSVHSRKLIATNKGGRRCAGGRPRVLWGASTSPQTRLDGKRSTCCGFYSWAPRT